MKKQINFSTQGQRADIGPITIYRMLANSYVNKVGPFVFFDHIAPTDKVPKNDGTGAHPHRGIATLTYMVNGEVEHFDSIGNHQMVHSGGIQWMKAGNGIIHDEKANYDSKTESKLHHAFQFWINLPAKIKADKPQYLAIQGNEVPQKTLPNDCGWIKVIVGNFEDLRSKIPNYSEQFLYHIQLEPGKQFSINMVDNIEVAAFLPTQNVTLNDSEFHVGDFVGFDKNAGEVELKNTTQTVIDILLFGGEEYIEPIVAEGPFVMNTQGEIAKAYKDFYAGKYGAIKYPIQ